MPSRRVQEEAALQEIYDSLPSVDCRGLCAVACSGGIPTVTRERVRLAERGVTLLPLIVGDNNDPCRALDEGRCSVYDVRPLVCRLWGVSDVWPCPYGCMPVGGRLTHQQTQDIKVAYENALGRAR